MKTKLLLFFGILIGIILMFACIAIIPQEEDPKLEHIGIVAPEGYEITQEDSAVLKLYDGSNAIFVYETDKEGVEKYNTEWTSLKSKNMTINGIHIIYKEYKNYNGKNNRSYNYIFNLNGHYYIVESFAPLNKNIIKNMLISNLVKSSTEFTLPNLIYKSPLKENTESTDSTQKKINYNKYNRGNNYYDDGLDDYPDDDFDPEEYDDPEYESWDD
ncbi:hypothetical protein [Methanobrevibacter curvatus]|uniref:Uncharacterized protein n=1 Tax=Methanobrevibacter curvatus TaxID=49547 RepID=A0A166ANA2_9EURY|nr:hypothetical protein [Methanobrevibacter curvatus]KZX12259.1 hypothetical protein MBCUR_11110 [Methanobrevibacter curvatus]